jgi:hypothetical protein
VAQLYTDKVPDSLLRSDNQGSAMRAKFERMIRQKQDEICAAVEAADGSRFHQDAWTRPGGGGGISRVLQGGKARGKGRPLGPAVLYLTETLADLLGFCMCFPLRCGRRRAST